MKNIEQKINAAVTQLFEADEQYATFFHINTTIHNTKMNVYVDSDDGINLGHCTKINKHLQGILDEANWMGGVYTLDVSSPGLSNPLVLLRQYKKNIGRMLKVTDNEDKRTKGKLVSVFEDSIVLEYEEVRKEGKKKIKETINQEINFSDIKKAVITVQFK